MSEALISQFLDGLWMERGLSENTLSAYRRDLTHLWQWVETDQCDQSNLLSLMRSDLLEYLAAQVQQQKSPRSIARMLSSLRRFYGYCRRQGLIDEDPTRLLSAPKLGRPLPDSLTEEQVEQLLHAPNVETALGLRDRAISPRLLLFT